MHPIACEKASMKTVKVEELQMWGFECPDCGHWNETGEDPTYYETITCDECGKEFIVEIN